jgi:hypothetical protein
MKKQKALTTIIALALAGTMLCAGPTLAQGRGQGQGGQGYQGRGCRQGQGQGQGQGQRYANCPNYQSQNCPRYGNTTPMGKAGRRGPQGGGGNNQSNPQPSAPPATQ